LLSCRAFSRKGPGMPLTLEQRAELERHGADTVRIKLLQGRRG
jgi:hypothetical protein